MNIVRLLEQSEEQVVAEAHTALDQARLRHYRQSGAEENRQRLHKLYRLVWQSLKDKNLIPLTDYIRDIATERFRAGFDVYEVHTAINVLEETIWRLIIKNLSPPGYAEALGLIGTALGAGKTCLAQTYVSLASKTRAPSMDLSAMFKGTEGT